MLPDGLFRDGDLPGFDDDPGETATFEPDWETHVSAASGGRPSAWHWSDQNDPPPLPDDLFRSDPPVVPPPAPVSPAATPEPMPRPAEMTAAESFGFRQLGAAETGVVSAIPAPVPYRPTPQPDPTAAGPRDRGLRGVMITLIGLVIVALIGGVVWLASSSPGSGTVARVASVTPAATSSSRQTPAPSDPSTVPTTAPVTPTPAVPSVSFPPAGAKTCRDGIAVRGSTSCDFAVNVAAAIPATLAPGGTVVVRAFSPTTNQTYDMTCVRAAYVTCTGGTAATVYVRTA